jgi:AcrR family transcriptional regulator
MPRPKTYIEDAVVESAKQVFWEHGFEGTAISDLEQQTGLNRSSLYHGFGAKRSLYAAVLKSYVADFVDPLLEAMERLPPRSSAIGSFFSALSELFTTDESLARRGCLIVNAMGERSAQKDEAALTVERFPERLRLAFSRSLKASPVRMTASQVDRRAAMLATATIGVWITARIDPRMAARRCEEIAREVGSWTRRPR